MIRGSQGALGEPAGLCSGRLPGGPARPLRAAAALALALAVLGPGFAPGAALTKASSWRLARGPSKVSFKVGHLVFLEVEGRFRRFSGRVRSAGPGFEGATIEATIEASSVSTGHRDRDRELRGEEFFAADRYPTLNFVSRSVRRVGERRYRVVGDLTIRDVSHEIVLDAEELERRRTSAGQQVRLRVSGALNRIDYGIQWNETWIGRAVLADTVEIQIDAALLEEARASEPEGR